MQGKLKNPNPVHIPHLQPRGYFDAWWFSGRGREEARGRIELRVGYRTHQCSDAPINSTCSFSVKEKIKK